MEKDILIQKLVTGTLTPEERRAVNDFLATDPAFEQEVQEYDDIQTAIALNEKQILKKQLQSLESNPQKRALYTIRWWMAAAMVLLVSTLFLLRNNTSGLDRLYESYYEPFPNTLAPVVRGDNSSKAEAFYAYEAQNYEEAASSFAQLLKKQEDPALRFYYSLSLLGSEHYAKALESLDAIPKNYEKYGGQILWYKALSQLKTNNKNAARVSLDTLIKLPYTYKNSEARAIIEVLDKDTIIM